MNKIEKKLMKLKGLYELLSKQEKNLALKKLQADMLDSKHLKYLGEGYIQFEFEARSDLSMVSLRYYKYRVKECGWLKDSFNFGLDNLVTDLSYGELLDYWYEGENFRGTTLKRIDQELASCVGFVRKALKDGLDSMDYGYYTKTVKVTDYLDFEEKDKT